MFLRICMLWPWAIAVLIFPTNNSNWNKCVLNNITIIYYHNPIALTAGLNTVNSITAETSSNC